MFRFENKDRKHADLLAKAGYVEFPQFEKMVKAQLKKAGKVYGYYCANCEYLRDNPDKSEYKLCARLKGAEVEPFGCCNLWEFTSKSEATLVPKPKKEEGLADMYVQQVQHGQLAGKK